MSSTPGFTCSTIGRKQLMAIAGLGLCGFVLMHVTGNLLLLVGPEAYNNYSHALTSNPLIYLAEAGLLAMIVAHAFLGLYLAVKNRAARPERYAVQPNGEKRTKLVMRTMAWQGIVILGFIILHLLTFKFGRDYTVDYGHGPIRDLFKLVNEEFHEPGEVIWYVIAVFIVGYHLSHGLYSSIQTLGFNHPRYTPKIKCASVLYGIFIAVGFAIQPIYMMFIYKG
jgi:succinate dehydrogenase / fumarate reductase cytochrome b subunit